MIADGALRSWDGAALTLAIAGAPAAKWILEYKLRMLALDGTKTLYGSKVGDPTLWAPPTAGSRPTSRPSTRSRSWPRS
jgi:hypothetical protein